MKSLRLLRACLLSLAITSTAALTAATVTVVPAGYNSTLPANGSLVFTFSEPMDPEMTELSFFLMTPPFGDFGATLTWSAQNKVLTCTKTGGWPTGMIAWDLYAYTLDDLQSEPVEADGMFTVSGGGGSTGSGTNAITSYLVSKGHFYSQNDAAMAEPDTESFEVPCVFMASVSLASNVSAFEISVTPPRGIRYDLSTMNPTLPEEWSFFEFTPALETSYPEGDYVFRVSSVSGNKSVTVDFNIPTQPPAPHVVNFTSLQTADPSKPITISWDPWQGGTAADYIRVSAGTNYMTPDPLEAGALNGTHTSVTIPANTLTPNQDHSADIAFYRLTSVTNATESREALRYSLTSFTLKTTGGAVTPGGPISFSKPSWNGTSFVFDVSCTPGQTITIETSATLAPGSWTPFLTTNAPGNKIQVTDPRPPGNVLFYRAR